MIRHLKHSEIDKAKWDRRIASSPQGLVYAFSWYLDIVSPGWEALVEDDFRCVFPLTCRRKAGINYLFQPYFTQQLGLFIDEKLIEENRLKQFIDKIPSKFKLIEIQLNTDNILSEYDGITVSQRLTHYLDLSSPIEILRKSYSENIIRNIKKAEKASLKISTTENYSEIINLFRENRGSDIENLKSRDYEALDKIFCFAKEQNLLDCRVVKNESAKVTAGAAFLKSVNSYIFIFSATGPEAKQSGAMSAIIDSFIKDHAGESSMLDFEGSMDVNLARFYKSFGSKEVVYLQIRKNNLPFIIRWLK